VKDAEYVLVTPARNEEAYIERTIEAVVSQTILPKKWVIVSDGSVDHTDAIVALHSHRHSFIRLLRFGKPAIPGRKDFGAKVRAFRAGYEQLNGTRYQFVGNLDADITFSPSYFGQLLERFERNPRLGLAGGIVLEPGKNGFIPQQTSLNSVCGAVQLFRRECYEAFGGYVPMRMGGVDAAAEIMARMHGWLVQTLPDVPAYAQRRVLTGGGTILHTRYRQGISNYLLGYHPLFQLASCLRRIGQKPYLMGSISALLGYGSSWLRGEQPVLPGEVVRFLRSEQMGRLANCLRWRK
jgi:cellulose synthase/poly-beta-1,6-N-acetylglucosamine synthase-like glycosyltransferase